MRLSVTFLFLLLICVTFACKKVPLKTLNHGRKQSGDNGYRLVIGNNIENEGYEAGKIYNCMSYSSFLFESMFVFLNLITV
jgi:hypothetical protein